MKQKHWQVSVFDKTSETIKNDTFYTTDTEAYLVFELIDEDFTPDSATVTIYNIYGKATINASVEVADGIVQYEIPEEAIGHPGGWRTQIIFTKDNEDYTTKIIEFEVGGHLLDNKKPAIVDIENWNSFIVHARELIDDWEQLEEIRQANEQQRELAESKRQGNELVRIANEVERVNAESVRAEFYEVFDGRLTGLESDRIMLNNLVENGDFSKGTTGWGSNTGVKIAVVDKVLEATVSAISASAAVAHPVNSDSITDIHYLTYDFKPFRTHVPIIIGIKGLTTAQEALANTTNKISILYTPTSTNYSISFRLNRANTDDMQIGSVVEFSNFIDINLTEVFGTGNEPTKAEMDELIKITGYFDEITLTQKQLLNWQLKLMRQNRNALIALGGTII